MIGKKLWKCILIYLLLFIPKSIFLATSLNNIPKMGINAQIGDILLYDVDVEGIPGYQKFVLTNISQNESATIIDYDIFSSESLSHFNQTADDNMTSSLFGNLSLDLISERTFFNLILLDKTNFTQSENEIQEMMDSLNEESKINVKFTIGPSGLSLSLQLYVRVLILIKVLELKAYYSSTGILLQADYWGRDPQSIAEMTGGYKIISDHSTVVGVDENPYNPLNIDLPQNPPNGDSSLNSTESNPSSEPNSGDQFENQGNFIWDLRAYLALTGVIVAGILSVSGVIWGVKRFKKK